MELNIANTLQQIYENSDILRSITEAGNLGLVGAVYDINTGHVQFKDFSNKIKQLGYLNSEALLEKLHRLIHPGTDNEHSSHTT